MAILTPNATYTMNGVTINEKIIPDGTVWKSASKAKAAGFVAGDLYKKNVPIKKVRFITIHNTEDLEGIHDDGEQYTEATYNENMGSTRVQYYIDDICGWQNLRAGTGLCPADPIGSAEVGWHAADGSTADGGNMTSIALEIIMGDTPDHDKKAYDNGARVAAWLLWRHGLTIDALVTHTYWVNKKYGKKFADVDEQCCNPVKGSKWCPYYIFNSTDKNKALKNWKAFKALVKGYLDKLNNPVSEEPNTIYHIDADDVCFSLEEAQEMLEKAKKLGFKNACITAYEYECKTEVEIETTSKKTNEQLAQEVIEGKWGCDPQRRERLTAAGYDATAVQAIVNQKMKGTR